MITPDSVTRASAELLAKDKPTIEAETAAVWGSRAVAAYALFLQSGDLLWFADAIEYDHEAREHAAGAGPNVLAAIETALDGMRQQCFPRGAR